jgi:hypothetical protein
MPAPHSYHRSGRKPLEYTMSGAERYPRKQRLQHAASATARLRSLAAPLPTGAATDVPAPGVSR